MRNLAINSIKVLIIGGFLTAPILVLAASPTLSFTVNPQTIDAGEASTLAWYSQNTYFCDISGGWSGRVSNVGTVNVFPTENTNYSINCAGPNGAVSDIKTVFVDQKTATNNPPIVYSSPSPSPPSPTPIPTPAPAPSLAALSAGCAASPTTVEVDKTVSVAAAQNGGYFPYTYAWSGDISGNEQVKNIVFNAVGIKTAKVTVTDSRGNKAESVCTINVTAKVVSTAKPTPTPAPKIVVAKAPTCKTVTICLDDQGNVTPKTEETKDTENKVETASTDNNGNGKKFFLASLFGSGGNGSSGPSGMMRKLAIYILPVVAALGVIALGYAVMKMGSKKV